MRDDQCDEGESVWEPGAESAPHFGYVVTAFRRGP